MSRAAIDAEASVGGARVKRLNDITSWPGPPAGPRSMNSPLPPRALPAHPRPHRLVVTASAIAAALGYLVWLRLTGASPASRGAVAAALFIVLDAVLVVLFWRASLRPALATRMVRALRFLAGAAAVALIG